MVTKTTKVINLVEMAANIGADEWAQAQKRIALLEQQLTGVVADRDALAIEAKEQHDALSEIGRLCWRALNTNVAWQREEKIREIRKIADELTVRR